MKNNKTHNNRHAISVTYELMSKNEREHFLLVTKHIFMFQRANNFVLLNPEHETEFLMFNATNALKIINFFTPSKICKTYNDNFYLFQRVHHSFFMSYRKCERIHDKIKELFFDPANEELFSKFMRTISLLNFMKKQTKNKYPQDFISYDLINKMNNIKPYLMNYFCSCELTTPKQIRGFIINYDYDWSCVNYLVHELTDDDCDNIHETLQLFL